MRTGCTPHHSVTNKLIHTLLSDARSLLLEEFIMRIQCDHAWHQIYAPGQHGTGLLLRDDAGDDGGLGAFWSGAYADM